MVMKWAEVFGLPERRSWLWWASLRRPDSSFAVACLVRCLVAELKDLFLRHFGPEGQEPVQY
jgi:hypothetical protein